MPWRAVAPFLALAVMGVLAILYQPPDQALAGHPQVVDGDTLRLAGTRIRLLGLDAPELAQTCTTPAGAAWDCGAEAKTFVLGLIGTGDIHCAGSARDRYGRMLARCDIGGTDLGAAIVSAGWAVPDSGYPLEAAAAQLARRGIWAGSFEIPAQWRRDHGVAAPGLWDWIRSWFQ